MTLIERLNKGSPASGGSAGRESGGLRGRLAKGSEEQSPRPSTPEGAPAPARGIRGRLRHKDGEEQKSSKSAIADRMQERYREIKPRIQNRMLAELDPTLSVASSPEVRKAIEEHFNAILAEEQFVLTRSDRRRLFDQIVAEILGFGPIEPLLADEATTDILVVGAKRVYVERQGRVHRTSITFEDDEHLLRIIDRIIAPLGRRIDESSPMVDARLPDGSRVNAVIPPVALDGPSLTIRKFAAIPLTVEDLIRFGTATVEVFEFLRACVMAEFNMIISGGSSSGKTTLLNILSGFIPEDERIVTIEDSAELQLRQPHVVRLESRPPNVEGRGRITIRDLVINSLRMRPDRIIVGEVRSEEAIDLLQAMNTGHDGSLGTLHANSPRDALARLETMCLMAGMDLPVRAIREQEASALHLIVHMARVQDGSRRIVQVTEVQGMEGDVLVLSDLFEWQTTGMEDGKVLGKLMPTGLRPKAINRIEEAGIYLSPTTFGMKHAEQADDDPPSATAH
jgi:pilus assembly protein CpaF